MDITDNWRNQKRFGNKRKFNYDTGFGYPGVYKLPYSQYHHNCYRGGHRYPKRYKKAPSRPPSPLRGTEEYRQRKIQHTSELIKRKLLTGEDISGVLNSEFKKRKEAHSGIQHHVSPHDYTERRIPRTRTPSADSNLLNEKHISQDIQRVQKTASSDCIDVEEIHNKIMKYITNLNHGRKVNLINSASSFYDTAIEQIQRQKRLDLSRALRAMCSNESTESVDVINSIIPDIGIKIEDLPRQVIEQLSLTFDFDGDEQDFFGSMLNNTSENCIPPNLESEYINFTSFSDSPSDNGIIDPESTLISSIVQENVVEPVNHESARNLKAEPPECLDETGEISTQIDLLDQPRVDNMNNFPEQDYHTNSIDADVNHSPQNCLKQESVHDADQNNDDGDIHINDMSDDCIILPPEPIEVIELDDETGFTSVSPILNCVPSSKLQDIDSQSVKHIASEKLNQNSSHRVTSTSTSDASVQVNLDKSYDESPKDLHAAVQLMLQIDTEIERLTRIRQKLFVNLDKAQQNTLEDACNSIDTCSNQLSVVAEMNIASNSRTGSNQLSVAAEVNIASNSRTGCDSETIDHRLHTDCVNNVSKDIIASNSKGIMKSGIGGNSERVLRKLTKQYVGSPQALKRDRFNPAVTSCASTLAKPSLVPSISQTSSALAAHNSKDYLSQLNTAKIYPSCSPNDNVRPGSMASSFTSGSSFVDIVQPSANPVSSRLSDNRSGSTTSSRNKDNSNQSKASDDMQKGSDHMLERGDAKFSKHDRPFVIPSFKQKVLAVQHIGKRLFLGTEKGKLFVVSVFTGAILKAMQVSSQAVTCFCYLKFGGPKLYVGTLSMGINGYNVNSYLARDYVDTTHSVQCMEKEWGYLFIGCQSGKLYRYSLKKQRIEFEDTISNTSIMSLKATQEGARKVLLLACRGGAICIRDAMSALHMRTLDSTVTPTVYSMILHRGDIYCGTLGHNLLVYSFNDGVLKRNLKETNLKGISCLKLAAPLIFASCYDGNVYVYNTAPRTFLGRVEGPGGMILSMEIVKNKIFVGTNKSTFVRLNMPDYIAEKIFP